MSDNKELFKNPPKDGNCVGKETKIWFPKVERGESGNYKKTQEDTAKAVIICLTCSVSDDCLEYSLRHEPWGIWGGKTELERSKIRKERNIVLSREGKIFIPGIGNRNANGDSLHLRPKRIGRTEVAG